MNGNSAKPSIRVELTPDNQLVCCQGDVVLGPYSEDALDLTENLERLDADAAAPSWAERAMAAARRMFTWRRSAGTAP